MVATWSAIPFFIVCASTSQCVTTVTPMPHASYSIPYGTFLKTLNANTFDCGLDNDDVCFTLGALSLGYRALYDPWDIFFPILINIILQCENKCIIIWNIPVFLYRVLFIQRNQSLCALSLSDKRYRNLKLREIPVPSVSLQGSNIKQKPFEKCTFSLERASSVIINICLGVGCRILLWKLGG